LSHPKELNKKSIDIYLTYTFNHGEFEVFNTEELKQINLKSA
jgi:hypothetical protein